MIKFDCKIRQLATLAASKSKIGYERVEMKRLHIKFYTSALHSRNVGQTDRSKTDDRVVCEYKCAFYVALH